MRASLGQIRTTLATWLMLGGVAMAEAPAPPTKAVDLSRYTGRWYEIARIPNQFEKGADCAAPTADYHQTASGGVNVVQTCHHGSPNGTPKVVHAAGRILDPGVNARLRLTFYMLVSKEYWVLDHAPDYQWAIVGDPNGRYLWFMSRAPTLATATRAELIQKAKAFGYDCSRLEYPAHH